MIEMNESNCRLSNFETTFDVMMMTTMGVGGGNDANTDAL